ncbi:MAG: hypothetical protein M1607_00800, partial [Patescibacteria group bacterium]|nr:hypothetical protein [Patescibacteria group bacterium]
MKLKKEMTLVVALLGMLILGIALGINVPKIIQADQNQPVAKQNQTQQAQITNLSNSVLPQDGFILPVSWGDLGRKLVNAGVIDEQKFNQAVQPTDEEKQILSGDHVDFPVTINSQNAQFDVDLLWAIGLAQKSMVYDQGPMAEDKPHLSEYASTGGWILAQGSATQYLNKFDLIPLTVDQQIRVRDIAMNIYRPCCDNSSWFPDCNHGMAALAAIEMMVSNNLSDDVIYRNILKLNSFWFPQNYLTSALYYNRQGT